MTPKVPLMPNKKAPAKTAPKRGRDETSTARGVAHLDRLAAAKGKRLVVDLDEPAREALEALLAKGYGETQRQVICRMLIEVAKRVFKKTA
jgi:hypothetical protein